MRPSRSSRHGSALAPALCVAVAVRLAVAVLAPEAGAGAAREAMAAFAPAPPRRLALRCPKRANQAPWVNSRTRPERPMRAELTSVSNSCCPSVSLRIAIQSSAKGHGVASMLLIPRLSLSRSQGRSIDPAPRCLIDRTWLRLQPASDPWSLRRIGRSGCRRARRHVVPGLPASSQRSEGGAAESRAQAGQLAHRPASIVRRFRALFLRRRRRGASRRP